MKELEKPWQILWPEAVNTQGKLKINIPVELKNEIIIYRAKQVHGDKYTYEHLEYKDARTKLKITCQEHGVFEATSGNLITKGTGCPRCSGKMKSNTEEFIIKAKSVHGNDTYDYSLVKYTRAADKVTIICKDHGPWYQQASKHLLGSGCPECASKARSQARALHPEVVFEGISSAIPDILLDKAVYVTTNTKMVVGCSLHGYWEATPHNLLRGHGCAKCANRSLKTTEEFISQAKEVHGNKYSYAPSIYTGTGNKLMIVCSTHGNFEQVAKKHLEGHGCPKCAGKEFGHLYLLKYPDLDSYKLGITNNVQKRLIELRRASPCGVLLVNSWEVKDTFAVEQYLLAKYTNRPSLSRKFDGYTELRVLTNEEVAEICLYLETI